VLDEQFFILTSAIILVIVTRYIFKNHFPLKTKEEVILELLSEKQWQSAMELIEMSHGRLHLSIIHNTLAHMENNMLIRAKIEIRKNTTHSLENSISSDKLLDVKNTKIDIVRVYTITMTGHGLLAQKHRDKLLKSLPRYKYDPLLQVILGYSCLMEKRRHHARSW
jgi:hypothetical protein